MNDKVRGTTTIKQIQKRENVRHNQRVYQFPDEARVNGDMLLLIIKRLILNVGDIGQQTQLNTLLKSFKHKKIATRPSHLHHESGQIFKDCAVSQDNQISVRTNKLSRGLAGEQLVPSYSD